VKFYCRLTRTHDRVLWVRTGKNDHVTLCANDCWKDPTGSQSERLYKRMWISAFFFCIPLSFEWQNWYCHILIYIWFILLLFKSNCFIKHLPTWFTVIGEKCIDYHICGALRHLQWNPKIMALPWYFFCASTSSPLLLV